MVQSQAGGAERLQLWARMPVDLLRGTLASNSVNLSSQTHPAVTGRRGHSELACVVGSASGYAGSPAGQAKGLSVCTELLKWEPSRDWLVETLPSGKAEREYLGGASGSPKHRHPGWTTGLWNLRGWRYLSATPEPRPCLGSDRCSFSV